MPVDSQTCKGAYRIDTLVDTAAGNLMAKIAWYDLRAKKYAAEYMKTVKEAASVKVERKAQKVALMRALRDSGQAAKFANERVLYGKPISFLQAISFAVAEIYTELDMCRLLCYRASWMKDQNMRFDTESAMAKSYTCDAAANCAKKAIEIHGAYGIMAEYKVQRLLRDAMVTISAGGTGEIATVVIGRAALAPFQKKG